MAVAKADVSSHATVKHGNSTGYSHAVAHAPVHPVASAYKPASVYKPAPAYKPAPVYKSTPVYQPAPVYKLAPTYHAPSYKQPSYADVPAKYQYEYAVADDYSGVNFGANEARDGYSTYGEYRVALPDCRTQVVKYNTADGNSGYVVEVTYEGTPCYDTYKPAHKAPGYHAPAPVYKPAPAYHAPAPAYKPAPTYYA